MAQHENPPVTAAAHAPHVEHNHEHQEHHDTFITKYIFSQDHKTIAKQFLILGIFWALIGALPYFRRGVVVLALNPESSFRTIIASPS